MNLQQHITTKGETMSYIHFTPYERGGIQELLKLGCSHRQIAKTLNRSRSSIDREIHRNSIDGVYNPEIAQKLYKLRAKRKGRMCKSFLYCNEIKQYMQKKWSPEQISNTILKNKVSTKSIYRWIYAKMIDDISYENLRHKGKLIKLKNDKRTQRFAHGKSLHLIPNEQKKRSFFGHWEIDTVLPSKGESKMCLATFAERKSRLYCCIKIKDRTAESMFSAICKLVNQLPSKSFTVITCDRGSEFLCSKKIEDTLNIPMYFTDPFCAWQKGTNENLNGLLREFFPKKTNFEKVSDEELFQAIELLNTRPRKCLGWKTPKEVFEYEVAQLN